jgi:hypothetical protein
MNSTPWSTSTFKISSNLSGAIILERHEAVHKAHAGGQGRIGRMAHGFMIARFSE